MAARFMADLQGMVDQAAAISFTNRETVDYQRRFLHFDPDKAFVLNHVGPPDKVLGVPPVAADFCYLGAVGPHRSAEPLLAGFHRFRRDRPDARLMFVGSSADYLHSIAPRCGGLDGVEILPFTRQVEERMRTARVLVSIDTAVEPAIFTPTKIIEYLRVDRAVLALTPKGSPVDQLLARSPQTVVAVHRYEAEAVAEGMRQAMAIPYDEARYRARFAHMRDFDADAVADVFDEMLGHALGGSLSGVG